LYLWLLKFAQLLFEQRNIRPFKNLHQAWAMCMKTCQRGLI
jgi:hypothetical protein